MLKEFYLSFTKDDHDSKKIKHIQYNLFYRLTTLKYIKYRRIDVELAGGDLHKQNERQSLWDDSKRARIYCLWEPSESMTIESKPGIEAIYKAVFYLLSDLWKHNNWNPADLDLIYKEIESEDFASVTPYGKSHQSPDKTCKAQFVCDVNPEVANYYLRILSVRKKWSKEIKFFEGNQVIVIFFMFFNTAYWRDDDHIILHDTHKEIFFVFSVPLNSVSIEYVPKEHSMEQLKSYLHLFSSGISVKEQMRILQS